MSPRGSSAPVRTSSRRPGTVRGATVSGRRGTVASRGGDWTGTGFTTLVGTALGPTRRQRIVLATRKAVAWSQKTGRAIASVVTASGWSAILAAVVCLGMGWGFGWRELAVAGTGFGVVVLLSAAFLLGRTRVSVELGVDEQRTVVGSPVHATVKLSDRGRWWWGSSVHVRIGERSVELALPSRSRKGDGEAPVTEFEVPADHRGVVTVGPVRTVRGDPIGLFRRIQDWTQTVEVHVHPKTINLPTTSTGLIRDLEGNPTRDLTASDISFHALREYRSGDERRHIHWKATAHTGQLTVRQFEETRRSRIVVAFGLGEEDYADDAEAELALSAGASVALRAIRDHRELSVVTSPPFPEPGATPARHPRRLRVGSSTRLLDDMSELVWGDTAISLGELAQLSATTFEGVSLVFLMCGSPPSARDLRSWSFLFPVGTQVVAVVCRPEQVPSMRSISELTVLNIGYLEDLPTAMSRSVSA